MKKCADLNDVGRRIGHTRRCCGQLRRTAIRGGRLPPRAAPQLIAQRGQLELVRCLLDFELVPRTLACLELTLHRSNLAQQICLSWSDHRPSPGARAARQEGEHSQ
jgi:hypothetical protein